MAPLRSPNFDALLRRKRRRDRAVLLSGNTSVDAIKNFSRKSQVASVLLIAMKLSSSSSSRRVQAPGCVFASVRSPRKVAFLDIWWPDTQIAPVFQIKASEGVSPLVGAQAHLEANFVSYLLAANEHCRSLGIGHGSVCVGECAVCES